MRPAAVTAALLAAWLLLPSAPARAQAPRAGGAPAAGAAQGAAPAEGRLLGQVYDGETGKPVAGATVSLAWPAPPDGSERRQEVRETGPDGAYEFASVPAGTYDIDFRRPGYRDSELAGFALRAGEVNRADLPLAPLPRDEAPEESTDVEEFLVMGSTVAMESLQLRADSDQLLNVLSAEELSKFAATDVAEGLKRVAGVNVVEGQFAIIRGLEDRYSSTLYNGAPIPSPDPDRQSVQLDLFPSEVVSDLVVAKTFAPDLPSNSSGGSIDIITQEYPDELEVAVKGGPGFNTNASQRFIEFESGSPVGKDTNGDGAIESEIGAYIAGRRQAGEREVRYKAVANWEVDYDTAEGVFEGRQPRAADARLFPPSVRRSGDLSLGRLSLSDGRFDETVSTRATHGTGYLAFGFDLDEEGYHNIDTSTFYTRRREEAVQLQENGYFPNTDYSELAQKEVDGQQVEGNRDFEDFATPDAWIRWVRGDGNEPASRGPLWFASFFESQSFERDRKLLVTQINGDHWFEAVEGLSLSWAANYARTTQDDESLGARYFYEPDDTSQIPDSFPVAPAVLGPGGFVVNDGIFSNTNEIEEKQRFARVDAEYQTDLAEVVTAKLSGGVWYEHATRSVDSSFLESPSVDGFSQFALSGATQEELGSTIFGALDPTGLRETSNDSSREVKAGNLAAKATLWEHFDLLGGFRFESIFIDSQNDAFTGGAALDGSPDIFPSKYLLFDRLDNAARNEVRSPPPPGTTFNDQLLGIDVPVDPITGLVDLSDRSEIESLVNGEIDETRWLPSVGVAYRPIEGLSLRGAWSKTVARPSFREMGYYVTVEPGTDDLVVGNPQLQLSDVESFDLRTEHVWGDYGDLVAVSGFYKTIQKPIESIVVRNPLNLEGSSSALFRTFFNNPNEATLWGVEVEGRKNLEFLGVDLAEYFTVGANFTYIAARVDRIDAELARSRPFFGVAPGDAGEFSELEDTRRLFGQPEWIANADVSFDDPDRGIKATLAFFAISDVLDAAGSAAIRPDGTILSFVPDRYIGSYYQLDLILSKTWRLEPLRGDLTLKVALKNLTDSTRKIVYDLNQTADEVAERSFKVGRDLKFTLSYSF